MRSIQFPGNYKALILDMDNTLYPETDYLRFVWKYLELQYSYDTPDKENSIADWLEDDFKKKGRSGLMNRFARVFQLPEDKVLKTYLNVLKTIELKDQLQVYSEWKYLAELCKSHVIQVFIISNGNADQQENKYRQLNLYGIPIQEAVWANNWKPKPEPEAFEYLIHKYSLDPADILSVGDSESDAEVSRKMGIDFIFVNFFREILRECRKP